jgi:hypothetical protein
MNKRVTIVTGLWNLGRGEISEGFRRSYDHYLERFADLMRTDANMFIYIAPEDEEFIWKHRSKENTVVKIKSLEEIKQWFEFSETTNTLRQRPEWISQAAWLAESPQATLEMYNPVVMSKMFLLNDATFFSPFDSEYYFWIDAGITSTVHPGYFYHDKVFDNLPTYCNEHGNFIFLSYPYIGGTEIHGFPREQIAKYCQTDYVKYVNRGGFFGGRKDLVHEISSAYYGFLSTSIREGLMGTEESIFTIISHVYPSLVHRFELEDNGLVWPFFEKLKDYKPLEDDREVALYVITYNSPRQFEELCRSFSDYDSNFLTKTRKYLLNNSTKRETDDQYAALCKEYDFEEIKKDNIGICGGRQFIAEHFSTTPYKYCIFYEDDMVFYNGIGEVCRNGFQRKIPDLFNKVVEIIKTENFDYLKFNFTEFFGDNSTQWSWYNVPQAVREQLWPDNCTLPVSGQSKNAPRTKIGAIKSFKQLAYASGEIYYCNWPQIMTQEGNKKVFLDTVWAYPYEQTWMSYVHQEIIKGNIHPGILLASPTEHNRFDHYGPGERKEH